MASTIVAELVTGRTDYGAEPAWTDDGRDGLRGQRDYTVNTCAIEDATGDTVLGLPKRGDAWSDDKKSLVVVGRSCRYITGNEVEMAAGGAPGLCWVRVTYEEPAPGRPPPAVPGLKYTLVEFATSSITRVYDVRYGTPDHPARPPLSTSFPISSVDPVCDPIANGRGASVAVGLLQIKVVQYVSSAGELTMTWFRKVVELQRKQAVNNAAVTLPPLLSTGFILTMNAGELQYNGCEIGPESGIVRVTHHLSAAPDFLERWAQEDEVGRCIGDPRSSMVYPELSFAGVL